MQAYYGKLTRLWRNLVNYQRAKIVEEISKEREEDKLHQFLMSLDETIYGTANHVCYLEIPYQNKMRRIRL